MRDFWKEPLSEEEKESLIERMAQFVVQRGLASPAIMMLTLHRPFAFIGSQAGIVFSPFLVPFFGFERIDKLTQLMSERENWDRLIERIEELEEERLQTKKKPQGETP